MLRQDKPAYEALVEALERGATLGEAIWAVERAARQHNLPGREARQPIGYIVNDQGVAVWTVDPENATAAATTSSNDETNVMDNEQRPPLVLVKADTPRTESKKPTNASETNGGNSKDVSLEVLKQYRTQVEEKLRDVDERLKELS